MRNFKFKFKLKLQVQAHWHWQAERASASASGRPSHGLGCQWPGTPLLSSLKGANSFIRIERFLNFAEPSGCTGMNQKQVTVTTERHLDDTRSTPSRPPPAPSCWHGRGHGGERTRPLRPLPQRGARTRPAVVAHRRRRKDDVRRQPPCCCHCCCYSSRWSPPRPRPR